MTTQNPAQDVSDQALGAAFRKLSDPQKGAGNPLDDFIYSVEERARELQQAQVVGEFCWLVELFISNNGNSLGHYHTGFTDLSGDSRTTANPREAKRYPTRAAAEQVASKLHNLQGVWRAVEHGFTTPQSSAPVVGSDSDGVIARLKKWAHDCEDHFDAETDSDGVFVREVISGDFYDVLNAAAQRIESLSRQGGEIGVGWYRHAVTGELFHAQASNGSGSTFGRHYSDDDRGWVDDAELLAEWEPLNVPTRASEAGDWIVGSWPEMVCRYPAFPNCLDSKRVIVTLKDGRVTHDRAERFGTKTPEWFIHRGDVIAWKPFPAPYIAAAPAPGGG